MAPDWSDGCQLLIMPQVNTRPIIPEVLPPERELPPDIQALEQIARILDEAVEVPGTGKRVGLDAAAGLVPGIGDAIGAALSTWIIIGGLRHRVPSRKIIRMIVNVLIDSGLGAVPIVGDLFDAFYHQNVGNLKILIDHRRSDAPPRSWKEIGWIGLLIFLLLLVVSLGVTIGTIMIIVKIAGAIGGA